jgi:hypothetical protein
MKGRHALARPANTGESVAPCRGLVLGSVACLKEAIAAGFHDFEQLKQDTDLAALRTLPELQNLFPKTTYE